MVTLACDVATTYLHVVVCHRVPSACVREHPTAARSGNATRSDGVRQLVIGMGCFFTLSGSHIQWSAGHRSNGVRDGGGACMAKLCLQLV